MELHESQFTSLANKARNTNHNTALATEQKESNSDSMMAISKPTC